MRTLQGRRTFKIIGCLLATALFWGCGDEEEEEPQEVVEIEPEAPMGSESKYAEGLDFVGEATVTNYEEFQAALDEAAADFEEYSDEDDAAFLIIVDDDIDDGFDQHGEWINSATIDIYVQGSSAQRFTIDSTGHSGRMFREEGAFGRDDRDTYFERLRFQGGDGGVLDGNPDQNRNIRLHVYDSVFTGNSAEQGAAIYGQQVWITNSVFTDNSATGAGTQDSDGGAVWVSNGLVVDSGEFRNNHAEAAGGAIHSSAEQAVSIVSSLFIDNEAASRGGALLLSDGGTIENSEFRTNSAGSGGVINYGPAPKVSTREIPLEIKGSTFIENQAANRGGVIHGDDRDTNGETHIRITDSYFDHNKADSEGGVAATRARDENIYVGDSSFFANDEPVLHTSWGGVTGNPGDLIDEGGNVFEGNVEPEWDN